MSNKQLFNKKSFSIRKIFFWGGVNLSGKFIILGGHASAAETIEATTRETTSIEHINQTGINVNTRRIPKKFLQEPSTTESTSNTQRRL